VSLSWRGARPKAVATPALEAAGPGAPTPTPGVPAAVLAPPPAATKPGTKPAGEAGAAPEEPRTSGFFVYRRLGSAAYGAPLVEEPLERRSLSDTLVPRGATACYVVRAASSTEPLIESAPSNEACVEVRDIAPPAPPAGLAVLPREGGLEVLWSPSAEADLAGYRVYREAPGGPPEKVADVESSHAAWLDETVERGVVYRYTVTALDQAGNESERAEPVEAGLP
jgi:hypothetical protein